MTEYNEEVGVKGIIVLLIIVGAVAVVFLAAKKKGVASSSPEIWPFYPKNVMSPPERVLYLRLIQALPDYLVLAQVQLTRFIGVKKGNNYQAWSNRINRMSADFVVCAKDSSVVAVVELDDSSHERADRKIADAKKDKALASAGVRIVRWNVKAIPDVASIRSQLHVEMGVQTTGAQVQAASSIASKSLGSTS